jgi:hypothetical protein
VGDYGRLSGGVVQMQTRMEENMRRTASDGDEDEDEDDGGGGM